MRRRRGRTTLAYGYRHRAILHLLSSVCTIYDSNANAWLVKAVCTVYNANRSVEVRLQHVLRLRGRVSLGVIRYRLKELIADREFRERRRITLEEVARATGISRNTLSRIANTYGYNTTTEVLDRLCHYFGCTLSDIAEHIPDAEAPREER